MKLLSVRAQKVIQCTTQLFSSIQSCVALLAASFILGAQLAQADHEKNLRGAKDQCSANEIIGKKVKNFQERTSLVQKRPQERSPAYPGVIKNFS